MLPISAVLFFEYDEESDNPFPEGGADIMHTLDGQHISDAYADVPGRCVLALYGVAGTVDDSGIYVRFSVQFLRYSQQT